MPLAPIPHNDLIRDILRRGLWRSEEIHTKFGILRSEQGVYGSIRSINVENLPLRSLCCPVGCWQAPNGLKHSRSLGDFPYSTRVGFIRTRRSENPCSLYECVLAGGASRERCRLTTRIPSPGTLSNCLAGSTCHPEFGLAPCLSGIFLGSSIQFLFAASLSYPLIPDGSRSLGQSATSHPRTLRGSPPIPMARNS